MADLGADPGLLLLLTFSLFSQGIIHVSVTDNYECVFAALSTLRKLLGLGRK